MKSGVGRSTPKAVTPIFVPILLLLTSHEGRFEMHKLAKK